MHFRGPNKKGLHANWSSDRALQEGCPQICRNHFLGVRILSDRFDRMAFLKKISDHFLIKCDQKINPLLERHRKKVLGAK